jgi:CRISPR-associated protein Csd2
VDVALGDEGRFKIYVQSGGPALNAIHRRAYEANGLKSTGARQDKQTVDTARAWMCDNFYDIRIFGAVMTTGVNCGQVRGPVQLTFARSHDPIIPLDLSITRVAITREEDANIVVSEEGQGQSGKTTEMGRKAMVPYGLYRAYGFFNPHFATQTGASAEDVELFWQALENMWDLDHSSSRGLMGCKGLYIFSHASSLGNAPAYKLFERVQIARKDGVAAPRSFGDYTVTVDDANMPDKVSLTALVG